MIGTRHTRAANPPMVPAFRECVWTIVNRSRRMSRMSRSNAVTSARSRPGPIPADSTVRTPPVAAAAQRAFSLPRSPPKIHIS